MEQSPLIIVCPSPCSQLGTNTPFLQAQTHARNATNAPDPATARVEHEQAADQFAAAAKGTSNLEVFACHRYSIIALNLDRRLGP